VGAESQYKISQILYEKAEYEKAEQNIFTLVSNYSTYDEWKYKGFLLLVRTYIGLDDLFQARATAESILENVNDEWVQNAASDLILEIETLEEGEPNGTDLIETGTLIDKDEK